MTGESAASYGALDWAVSGRVARITLNRPAALNALDHGLKVELMAAFEEVGRSAAIGSAVLTGAGRAFCAGQDLREIPEPAAADEAAANEAAAADARAIELERIVRELYNPLILAIRELEKPVVAAVNGPAVGAGLSLAVACDVRVASDTASFRAGFGRIALVPDSGISWLLPRLVGLGLATEILLGGETVDASRAERIGLVNRVVPADRLLDEADALAGRLAEASPLAAGLTKRELNLGLEVSLEEALDLEARMQGIAARSADHAEGLAAFRAKRPPRFEGR